MTVSLVIPLYAPYLEGNTSPRVFVTYAHSPVQIRWLGHQITYKFPTASGLVVDPIITQKFTSCLEKSTSRFIIADVARFAIL